MIYLIKKLKFVITILILLISPFLINATENRILYKVNNEIITSYDLKKEFKYLSLINPTITNLDKNEIFEVSKNSVIREKIKKIEILKHVENIVINNDYIDSMIIETYTKIGLNNNTEFEKKINNIGMSLDEFKEKLSIEALWNQLIYEKYKSKVQIDISKLKKEISLKKTQNIFNLSEIVFNIEKTENYSDKLKQIVDDIENKGFDNAALIHSVSETRSFGGNLGWINENSISRNLKEKINNTQIGEYSSPIIIQGGILIIKINEIKKEKVSLDINKELDKLIKLKTNQQLNRFSNIYFNKIKKNLKIEKI
ncbi:peptidylprolyl isomerase [Candidatus Pelagibacter sp.]|nr:peptidylprolyl isomerase [Candidatus Pelagibacter sp.]